MKDLSQEEIKFLIGLLENLQISGNAEQVRVVLRLRDEILAKMGSARKGGDEEEGKEWRMDIEQWTKDK